MPEVIPSIDPQIQSLLPPLTEQEYADLTQSILDEGRFHTPIFVWGEYHTIIDGHHRWKIWESLPADTHVKPPKLEHLDQKLLELSDVRAWIARNQGGRRNMTEQQLSLLRGRLYNQIKADAADNLVPAAKHKNAENPENLSKGQIGPSRELTDSQASDTAAQSVASLTKSKPRTVKRDAVFAKAVDRIGELNSKAKADIEVGNLKLPKGAAPFVRDATRQQVAQVLSNLRNDRAWDFGLSDDEEEKELADEVPKKLQSVFETGEQAKRVIRKVAATIDDFLALEIPSLATSAVQACWRDLRQAMLDGIPYKTCPLCKGKGCTRCGSRGYVTEFQWKGLTKNQRDGQ